MKTKICENCGYCKRIYTCLWYTYWQANRFYCTAHEKLTEKESSCERWKKEQKSRTPLSIERLDEAERDIKIIFDIVKEKEINSSLPKKQ